MNAPTCGHCGARVDAATLCRGCVKTLAWALANIAAYLGDLDTIRTRRTRFGGPVPLRRGGGPIPLPVDHRFTDIPGAGLDEQGCDTAWGAGTDLAWVARNTLTTWIRHLLEQHPHLPGPSRNTAGACCAWLLTHSDRIRVNETGPELLDELLDLERQLRRFVDHPPELTYVGPCTAGLSGLAGAWICGADLYASAGKAEVTCRQCNASYQADARRAWLLGQAEDEWHTAPDIAHALVTFSDDVSGDERRLANRIRQWAKRGRLSARDKVWAHGQEAPRYRLGDVLSLVYESPRHAEDRAG